MAFWKGSQGSSREVNRKKEEGCVQDPEAEKQLNLAEGSMEVKSIKDSNRSRLGLLPT